VKHLGARYIEAAANFGPPLIVGPITDKIYRTISPTPSLPSLPLLNLPIVSLSSQPINMKGTLNRDFALIVNQTMNTMQDKKINPYKA
jgi:hypothetical protein